MKVLVVHAHPSDRSFSAAIRDRALASLEAAGHSVTLHDLYRDGFDPLLSAAERLEYDSDHPVVTPMVRRYADDLNAAEAVVFIYPTWWWGLPAILKGWFDRVLLPGEALIVERRFGPPRPGLTSIRRLVGITSYGSTRFFARFQVDGGRRLIRRALRFVCSPVVRTRWLPFYGVEASTLQERERFLEDVARTMEKL